MDARENPDVRALLESDAEVVPAAAIAPIVKMHPSVMIDKVRSGEWDLCATMQSGGHVKFFRRDFLRKSGLLQDEKEELLRQMVEELKALRDLIEMAMKGGNAK